MSSRLTRAGGFCRAVTTVASPTRVAASRVSTISIEPPRIATRSKIASISLRISDAIAGSGADAIRHNSGVAADLDLVEMDAVVAVLGVLGNMDGGDGVPDASAGAAKSRGAIEGNSISLLASCGRGPRRLNHRFESTAIASL